MSLRSIRATVDRLSGTVDLRKCPLCGGSFLLSDGDIVAPDVMNKLHNLMAVARERTKFVDQLGLGDAFALLEQANPDELNRVCGLFAEIRERTARQVPNESR